jgi:hypothetical protein
VLNDPILRLRFWGLLIVRAISVTIVVYGSICFLLGLGTGFANYGGINGLYHGLFLLQGSENWSWLWYGVALMAPGIVMMIFSRRIVRWTIPVPVMECAECGYALKNLQSEVCPECGYDLAPRSPNESSPGA